MFENLSLLTLQQYWWFLVSLIGALFIFTTFVQGGQTLLYKIAKNEKQRDVLVASLGRKWELAFTGLVMFGGALFAAFPLFYAVSFSGAYYVWMAILFCFIIQAVSYEYRKKPNNFLGKRTYEVFLFINGSLGIILIGIALGTLFTGGNFIKNDMNLSAWTLQSRGLEAILNPFNVAFGLTLFFLARVQASLYFLNNIAHKEIEIQTRIQLKNDAIFFVGFFVLLTIMLLTMSGFSYDMEGFYIEKYKFLSNFLATPILLILFLLGTIMVLYAIFISLFKNSTKGIWFSGIGTVLVTLSLLCLLGFNHTAIYPSLSDIQSSLNIENSSGSHYTLSVMGYVSLMVPFVLGYIVIVWRAMDKTKITSDEIQADKHHY
ncbi:MAG TPA: cytochrome d ubiquinol oxidase subunit II [Sulfurospirillum arcachonense]|nr:cytochrome d ubiquinol oxidase subunit II [Sulfurospirillum arcachonense]HIP45716.1 cytochrome d ubiquinol oxidase subunit II [Sulfurospirillum arcachonense]